MKPFIVIGGGLILNTNHIVSANLTAKDESGNDCIIVKLSNGDKWCVWKELPHSKEALRSILKS